MFSLTAFGTDPGYAQRGRTPASLHPHHCQTGLTLLELLIASAIGIIFMSAMIRVYIDAKQSYRLNTAKTILHEDSRATFRIIGSTIAQAGYRNTRDITLSTSALFPNDGDLQEAQVIRAQALEDGGWALSTRFQGNTDGLISDCLGNQYLDDHLITQTLTFTPVTQTLRCQVRCVTTASNHLSCPSQDAVITDNLRALDLLVGREGAVIDSTPTQYRTIADFSGSETDILAFKARGWFESELSIRAQEFAQTFEGFTSTITETDRHLRLAFSETFSARNRLP